MFQKIQLYFEYCNSGLLPILCVVYHFRTLFWIARLSFSLPQAEVLSPSCDVKMVLLLEITGVVLTSYMVYACHCQFLFSYKPIPRNEPSVPRICFSFTRLLWNAIIFLLSSATLGREHLHMHVPLISGWVVLHLAPPDRPAGLQLQYKQGAAGRVFLPSSQSSHPQWGESADIELCQSLVTLSGE